MRSTPLFGDVSRLCRPATNYNVDLRTATRSATGDVLPGAKRPIRAALGLWRSTQASVGKRSASETKSWLAREACASSSSRSLSDPAHRSAAGKARSRATSVASASRCPASKASNAAAVRWIRPRSKAADRTARVEMVSVRRLTSAQFKLVDPPSASSVETSGSKTFSSARSLGIRSPARRSTRLVSTARSVCGDAVAREFAAASIGCQNPAIPPSGATFTCNHKRPVRRRSWADECEQHHRRFLSNE